MSLLLRAATDILRVALGSAADVECMVSALQADSAAPPALRAIPNAGPLASFTTAATHTIFDTSGLTASDTVNIIGCSLHNNHASTATTALVEVNDGTNTVTLANVNLLAGERLELGEDGRWLHYDSNGGLYPSVGNAASQAEMEAGTATDKYVTPQGVNWHPGACKAWGKAVGAGTSLTVNWNIASIADTGTGRLGVTIGTDFSSANYAVCATVERVSTSLAVASVDLGAFIRNASPTAGVFEIENFDETATTNVAQDPANYFWACFGDQ